MFDDIIEGSNGPWKKVSATDWRYMGKSDIKLVRRHSVIYDLHYSGNKTKAIVSKTDEKALEKAEHHLQSKGII